MKRLFTKIALLVAGITGVAKAQQDPQFTQFMYNKLIYNPGYAGTSGSMCGMMQFRQQWSGFTGAPQTMALSADMRLPNELTPIGVGINIMSDKIGVMNTMFLRAAASYNILKIAGGTLGIGLDFGMLQKTISGTFITPEPLLIDNSIPGNYGIATNPNLGRASFDLGFGAFYQIPGKFYAGLSSTHLTGQNLADKTLPSVQFQVTRHYYFMTGYTMQLNKWSKLTPNIMFKTDIRSSSMDLNLTYLWSDMVWLGGTYRLDDGYSILLGYQGKALPDNKLGYKIGYSYDVPGNTNLGRYGSHEIMVSVCYTPSKKVPTVYSDPRFLD
jgi:type IX secretion system PorP/SprF family membrane protein